MTGYSDAVRKGYVRAGAKFERNRSGCASPTIRLPRGDDCFLSRLEPVLRIGGHLTCLSWTV